MVGRVARIMGYPSSLSRLLRRTIMSTTARVVYLSLARKRRACGIIRPFLRELAKRLEIRDAVVFTGEARMKR